MRNFINIILENEPEAEPDGQEDLTEWQAAVEDGDWEEALFCAETPQEVAETLRAAGAEKLEFHFAPNMPPIYVFDDSVVTWNGTDEHGSIESKENWLDRIDPEDYFTEKADEFNKDFWYGPCPLYHATTEDHVDDILEHGLECRDETRGLSNRGVGSAVFTTSSFEETERGSYGDYVFKIDTKAMKADGYCPYVSMEPQVVAYELRMALAHHIGAEDYVADESNDISPDTVIIQGDVPAKYLTLLEE